MDQGRGDDRLINQPMPLKPLVSCHQLHPLNRTDGEQKTVERVFGIRQWRCHGDGMGECHWADFNAKRLNERTDFTHRHCERQFAFFKLDRNFPNTHHADDVRRMLCKSLACAFWKRWCRSVDQRDEYVGIEDQGFFQPSLGILMSSGQGE